MCCENAPYIFMIDVTAKKIITLKDKIHTCIITGNVDFNRFMLMIHYRPGNSYNDADVLLHSIF